MSPLKLFAAAAFVLIGEISSVKAAVVTGPIYVYNGAGTTLLGYVSDTYDSQKSFTYTTNLANALQVQVTTPVSSPFSILELNPPGPNQYFGAVGGSGGYDFASGGYTYLSGTALTAAGAGTSASNVSDINLLGYYAPVESTIWTVNNNILTSQWVNSNGSVSTPQVSFYDPVVDYIGLTSNLTTYNNNYGDGAIPVTLEVFGLSSVPEPASLAIIGIPSAMALLRRRRTSI